MTISASLQRKLSFLLALVALFLMLAFASCKEDDCEAATNANAGPDQNIFGDSTTLAANSPESGRGTWTIVSGEGGTVQDPTNPASAFTGVLDNTYVLKWSITGCPASEDEVTIIFSCSPVSTANAGPDQNVVGTTAMLAGNTPTTGNGTWVIASGAGGVVAEPSNPSSEFTGVAGAKYTLKWTISGCGTSEDMVDIEFFNTDPKFLTVDKTTAMCGEILTVTGLNFSSNYQGNSQVNFVKVGVPYDGQITYLFILSRTATEIKAVVSGANGGEPGTYNLKYLKRPDANAPVTYPSNLNVELVSPTGFYTSQNLSSNNVAKGSEVSFGVKNGTLVPGDYTLKLVAYDYETGVSTETDVSVSTITASAFNTTMDKLTFTVPMNIPSDYYFVKVTHNNKTLIGGWGTGLNVY